MRKEIEVAVSPGVSNKTKGQLLEKLARELIETMRYDVTEQVRITGIEVDLLAVSRMTNEKVFVECKAWRDALPADVITKLLGNITLHDADCGWLVTTGPLGSDAKGVVEKWQNKAVNKRKQLQFYLPGTIVDQLISISKICDPLTLNLSSKKQYYDTAYLLITDHGRFWAIPIVLASAGLPQAVVLFDAKTGRAVTDKDLIKNISLTDTTLKELEWLPADQESVDLFHNRDSVLVDSVVPIIHGDNWTDYRPSRPEDFVGRKTIQNNFFDFLKDILDHSTSTRLIAFKSPSGWGKSSLIIKLADRCKNRRNRRKYFLYHVDLRAATSSQYPDLALTCALDAAVNAGFLDGEIGTFKITSLSQPLDHRSVQDALKYLREHNRILIIFFDQFEEIFTKRELEKLFDRCRALASTIDAAKENIVLGFAWKTDSAIPQDHRAYYMWHNLADRRKEVDLTPFSRADISSALSIFSRELGEPLNPLLKKVIVDQCQGYPWLVKKLCLHIYDLIQEGVEQLEAVARSLDIKKLFEKDKSDLTPGEDNCLKRIAIDSPADFFSISDFFGNDTVQSLINRRLVIRRGSRLTLYWDIFRDYVLTENVPRIPITYIPQTNFSRYVHAIEILTTAKAFSLSDFAQRLSISMGAADNSARDLVMVGNGIRQGESIHLRQNTLEDAHSQLVSFMSRHISYMKLIQENGPNFKAFEQELETFIRSSLPFAEYSRKTWKVYTRRLISWLVGAGLISNEKGVLTNRTDPQRGKVQIIPRARMILERQFLCQAPPHRLIEVITHIRSGLTIESQLLSKGLRNALDCLKALGILVKKDRQLYLVREARDDAAWLCSKVRETLIMTQTLQVLAVSSTISPISLGDVLSEKINPSWRISSKRRYGAAALRWAKWIKKHETQTSFLERIDTSD